MVFVLEGKENKLRQKRRNYVNYESAQMMKLSRSIFDSEFGITWKKNNVNMYIAAKK